MVYRPPPPLAPIKEVSCECCLLLVVNKPSLGTSHAPHARIEEEEDKTTETACQKGE